MQASCAMKVSGPGRRRTTPEKHNLCGNYAGDSWRHWRANRPLYLGSGSKDQPNHLAGHHQHKCTNTSHNKTKQKQDKDKNMDNFKNFSPKTEIIVFMKNVQQMSNFTRRRDDKQTQREGRCRTTTQKRMYEQPQGEERDGEQTPTRT